MRVAPCLIVMVLLLAACPARTLPPAGPAPAGGRALMVVGTIPLVGTDAVIRDALAARGVGVDEVLEAKATASDAAGKRLVILSFSMQSTRFAAAASYRDVPVPIIVLEHFLLDDLGMTTDGPGHGFQNKVTALALTGTDPVLTAGLPAGEVTVYRRVGEMFWGVPGPGAVRVATVQGNPERVLYFAYPAGAMMVSQPAPAKRLHFFFAVHAPPPVTDLYLNDAGLKLLGGAIDWSLR
jgi:hypothetical protein